MFDLNKIVTPVCIALLLSPQHQHGITLSSAFGLAATRGTTVCSHNGWSKYHKSRFHRSLASSSLSSSSSSSSEDDEADDNNLNNSNNNQRRKGRQRRQRRNQDKNEKNDDDDDDDNMISLQDPHGRPDPATVMRKLAQVCDEYNIDKWDVYGDYQNNYNKKQNEDDENRNPSFLRRFEAQVARDLGHEDAVFMPSGVMAQSIALLIHQQQKQQSSYSNGGGASTNGDSSSRSSSSSSNNIANTKNNNFITDRRAVANRFICHDTSHLMLHEEQAYEALLGFQPIIIPSTMNGVPTTLFGDKDHSDSESNISNPLERSPLTYRNVMNTLANYQWSDSFISSNVVSLLVECPHRELGGRCTSWEDLRQLRQWCTNRRIALHCDGARLWEAASTYYHDTSNIGNNGNIAATLKELASLFDSVYVSVYKGLGGLSGALLVGNQDFCNQARVWLRRMGGNLYTLLPYVVAAMDGHERHWKATIGSSDYDDADRVTSDDMLYENDNGEGSSSKSGSSDIENTQSENNYEINGAMDPFESANGQEELISSLSTASPSFVQLRDKLRELVANLSSAGMSTARFVDFDPPIPVTNMVHGYLRCTADEGLEWCRWITDATGVEVLRRIQSIPEDSPAYHVGYRSKFEWTLGPANGRIPDDVFYEGWTALAETYLANHEAIVNGESPIYYGDEDRRSEEL